MQQHSHRRKSSADMEAAVQRAWEMQVKPFAKKPCLLNITHTWTHGVAIPSDAFTSEPAHSSRTLYCHKDGCTFCQKVGEGR